MTTKYRIYVETLGEEDLRRASEVDDYLSRVLTNLYKRGGIKEWRKERSNNESTSTGEWRE